MFKFNFDIEDAEDIDDLAPGDEHNILECAQGSQNTLETELEPFTEHSLDQLLDSLPDKISYSPLCISLSSARKSVTLIRRDLFDARFQLISSDGELDSFDGGHSKTDKRALEFLDNPSDLIPGVYEGGLKTWECSLDLVDYLDSLKDQSNHQGFVGKNILELGCGTSIPSLYVFRELLFSSLTSKAERTELHLQDYNAYTLQLVTIPNLLLTWYTSPSSSSYRTSMNDAELAPSIDPTIPGELTITSELKRSFVASLESLNITLTLFSGSWRGFYPKFTLASNIRRYDVLLTSETIYHFGSLPLLINLMRTACTGSSVSGTELEKLVPTRLRNHDLEPEQTNNGYRDYLCLVASKVLYFGVGGGVSDFLEAVNKVGGNAETIAERKIGVGRKVIRVHW